MALIPTRSVLQVDFIINICYINCSMYTIMCMNFNKTNKILIIIIISVKQSQNYVTFVMVLLTVE